MGLKPSYIGVLCSHCPRRVSVSQKEEGALSLVQVLSLVHLAGAGLSDFVRFHHCNSTSVTCP